MRARAGSVLYLLVAGVGLEIERTRSGCDALLGVVLVKSVLDVSRQQSELISSHDALVGRHSSGHTRNRSPSPLIRLVVFAVTVV